MSLDEFLAEWHNDSPTVLVHTSGSTGKPKPMRVEKRRMEASARITCDFLGLKAGDTALLCLPLDYIAGKMMVVRALTCGLKLIVQEPSGLPQLPLPSERAGVRLDFAAMVPMQVWNLLHDAEGRRRLQQIRHLIIGGGAIDEALEQELQNFPNAVWSTYGMTETLSHIALRRLNGPERSEWYTPLPGVQVSLNEEQCLVINAPAVCDKPLVTNDIGILTPDPSQPSLLREGTRDEERGIKFRILGRKDNVICSGGIKIQIEEVERLLKPHIHVPFIISKAPDERLGEQVVLIMEALHNPSERGGTAPLLSPEGDSIDLICRQVLPKYWQPRRVIVVDHIPLTETGKPARAEAERLSSLMLNV